MIVKVLYGQSLMDVAIQMYGSAGALMQLAQDNGLALDADVFAGDELFIQDTYPETAISVFADYLTSNNIKVVSGQGGDSDLIEVLSTNDDEVIIDNDDNGLES